MIRSLLVVPILLALTLWICAAIWIDGPSSRVVAGVLVATVCVISSGLLIWVPLLRRILGFGLMFAATLLWWFSIAPSNDRDWDPAVARLPVATIEGDRLTIRNVRNFDYSSATDYEERWEDRSYDLALLRGADLFLSYWGSPWIAHTIMSWEFADGQRLAVSIETRKEKSESYSALLGFFRQYELYYVVADERDLVGLRTNFRDEDVYLYRLAAAPTIARGVLLDYVDEINRLAGDPRWYNAATHNCTTTIRHHVQHVAPGNPWNWRILVNGRIDELGYERGNIATDLPFDEMRRRSAISIRAREAGQEADFSERIRRDLPPRPRPRG